MIVYGDYECAYCAKLHLELKNQRAIYQGAWPPGKAAIYQGAWPPGNTLVFRHFPVVSKHPRSEVLARAAEAAALQGRFWDFHDSLYADQGRLDDPHLWERCERLGMDLERFDADRRSDSVGERVQRDFRSGIRAGVVSTPGIFR